MRILALIAARGGSKRLPGKNIRMLGGKPLILWSVDVAKDIPEICDILVSTDDPRIASVCADGGAFVPWLRPQELATDTASSDDVALHALNLYEAEKGAVDGLLLLQPTSPFRTRETLIRGIQLFRDSDRQSVMGVASSTHAHPMNTLKMENNYLVPFMKEHALEARSQDLPMALLVTGSFYLISPVDLRASRSFMRVKAIPLFIDSKQEAWDIDTAWDFQMAQLIAENIHV